MEKIGRVVATAILCLGIGLAFGCWLGFSKGRTDMMIEAVKQNHGHYKIVDELGRTQFEWGQGPAIPIQK